MTLEEYSKDFQSLDSFTRYMHAFINADNFKDEKRFIRYVSKTKTLCDKLVRQKFDSNIDTYQFVIHEIRAEAELARENIKDNNEDEDIQEEKQYAECETDEAQEIEPDYEQMKFIVKRHHDELGIAHNFDIIDALIENFSFFYDYAFVEPNIDNQLFRVGTMIWEHEMLELIKSGKYSLNDEHMQLVLNHADIIMQNFNTVCGMVEEEFKNSCFAYLYSRIAEEKSTINFDNFVLHGLPRGDGEIMMIIANTIDRTLTNLINITRDENSVKVERNTDTKIYSDKCCELESANDELQQQLTKEQDKNLILRKKLEGFEESKKKEFENLKKDITALSLDKSRLEKKNMGLEEECERLRCLLAEAQKIAEQKENISVEDVKIEIDMNKKYVFVMDGNPYGEEQLLKAFPNASIIFENVNLNVNTTDVVVCITSRVKHCVYESIKAQCKTKGIPFVHCMQNNVDVVKRVLYETGY